MNNQSMALVVGHSLKRRLSSCVTHPFSTHHSNDTTNSTRPIQIYNALDQGCMEYSKSWAWQHVLLSRRLEHRRRRRRRQTTMTTNYDNNDTSENDDDQDCILFLEHSPVYTLGRGSDESHLTFLNSTNNNNNDETIRHQLSRKARGPGTARLAVDRGQQQQQQQQQDTTNTSIQTEISTLCQIATPVISPNGVPIYRVERGGEVTFHGPQQLVVYPLIDLKREPYRQDLHWYLRMVEEVIIQTLAHYNIKGERDEDDNNTGVWVNNEKVAAVGISSSRWITTHGFALNVNPNLDYFDTSNILPCGIEGKGVTSMAKIMQQQQQQQTLDPKSSIPSLLEVSKVVLTSIQQVFGISKLEPAIPPKIQ